MTSHGPSPSRTSAVCSSTPTSTASAGEQLDRTLAQMVGRAAVVREHREAGTSPSPTVYAPPRGSTIGSHEHASRPRPTPRSPRPVPYAYDQRVVQRAALQHRAQVQRRAVGDVDEARDAHARRRSRRLRRRGGSAPASPSTFAPSAVEPRRRPLDGPLGMLERGRGRAATTTSSAAGQVEQVAVERAARLGPLAAAERARAFPVDFVIGADPTVAGSLGDGYAPVAWLGCYSPVTCSRFTDRRSGSMAVKRVGIVGSGIMGSGIAEVAAKAGHRGRAAQPRAGDAPTRWSPGSRSRWPSRSSGASSKPAERDAVLGRVARRHRPRRARRLRPRDRVDRRGPRRQEAPLQRARPHLRRARRSSRPTRRRCRSSRWRWRPAAPSGCAASTSSTPRR